jgi:hypothetical protein
MRTSLQKRLHSVTEDMERRPKCKHSAASTITQPAVARSSIMNMQLKIEMLPPS